MKTITAVLAAASFFSIVSFRLEIIAQLMRKPSNTRELRPHLAATVLVQLLGVALQPRDEGHGARVHDGGVDKWRHAEHEQVRGDGAGAV